MNSTMGGNSAAMSEANALVQLAVDPKGAKKRLAELGAKEDDITAAYKALGIGTDAVKARDEAKADRDVAAEVLEQARQDAEKIVKVAQDSADHTKQLVAKADKVVQDRETTADVLQHSAETLMATAEAKLETVVDREVAVAEAELKLQQAGQEQTERVKTLAIAVAAFINTGD